MLTNISLPVLYGFIVAAIVLLVLREDPHHTFILELLERLARGTPAIVDGDTHSPTEGPHEHWDTAVDRHHPRRAHV